MESSRSHYSSFSADRKCINSKSLGHLYESSNDKPCISCGTSGLCTVCDHKNCFRTFHPYCISRYFPSTPHDSGFFCDRHIKNRVKEHTRLFICRQVSNQVNLSPATQRLKDRLSQSKSCVGLPGQVLWYCIGSQYFPNFIELNKPEFQIKTQIDLLQPWNCNIEEYISRLSTEYTEIQTNIQGILNECGKFSGISREKAREYREEDLILAEIRDLKLRDGLEEYLRYYESHNAIHGSENQKKNGGRGVYCTICGDEDFQELIIRCVKCNIAAHIRCYGITGSPTSPWTCDSCKVEPKDSNLKCALCPNKGGLLKPTSHITSNGISFPNYPAGKNEVVWCHIFCLSHFIPNAFYENKSLDSINLTTIDPKRFKLKCQICKTKTGACLQCQYGRCQASFHPECAKDLFIDSDCGELSIFCALHKPLRLRRTLELKESKCVEDIINFCKDFEREERIKIKGPNKRKLNEKISKKKCNRPFSYNERVKFIKAVDDKLALLPPARNNEFSITIKTNPESQKSRVHIIRPQLYNLLDPQTILANKISVKGRKLKDCHKFYSDFLLPLLRKEVEILNIKPKTYLPSLSKKHPELKPIKKPKPHKPADPKIPLPDIVSDKVYCICRQPFIEMSLKKDWETDKEFEERQKSSQMVQCDRCEEWYHFRCLGLNNEASALDSFICVECIASDLN